MRFEQLKEEQADNVNAVIYAREGERKRISRDLHDDIGAKLSALKLSITSLTNRLNNPDTETRTIINSSQDLINEIAADIRLMLQKLSSVVLEEFGYTTAVRELVNTINETKLLHIELVIFGFQERLNNEYELALYRITQEMINNILKHAKARNACLQAGYRNETIILMMEDDGVGFDIYQRKTGYGSKNIEARTQLLHGKMNIDSSLAKGTCISIEIPYTYNRS